MGKRGLAAYAALGFVVCLGAATPPWRAAPVAPASAQGALLTGAGVAAALSAAIDRFRAAIAQAGDEVRSAGNSLQANAQNVLQDLNNALKDRMGQAITALEAQERRLAEDAEALTKQLEQATERVAAKAGEEARRTIVEADIAAYNTMYSLPCRDQRPRVVAAFPGEIITAQSEPILTLRGNYFDQGASVAANVGGRPATVVERLATSLRVRLPDEVAPASLDMPRTVSVEVTGLQTKDRTLWFGLACREREVPAAGVAAALTIEPQITHGVQGTMRTFHMVEHQTPEASRNFSREGSDKCDDSFPVTVNWCSENTAAVSTRAALKVNSANCGSGIQSSNPSGPRCVVVDARVQGCGATPGPFDAWLGCKGRGWLDYDITLTTTTRDSQLAGARDVTVEPSVAQRSWSWRFPEGKIEPRHEYEITVVRTQGKLELGRWTVSGANPNAGPIKSRVADGALAVELAD